MTLTIYALAHDSNSTEDVYISLHDKVKLYIKINVSKFLFYIINSVRVMIFKIVIII